MSKVPISAGGLDEKLGIGKQSFGLGVWGWVLGYKAPRRAGFQQSSPLLGYGDDDALPQFVTSFWFTVMAPTSGTHIALLNGIVAHLAVCKPGLRVQVSTCAVRQEPR